MNTEIVRQTDPEIARILCQEYERQEHNLELIASENIASDAVMAVQGSVLTNKYAEGYPARRYYGGCEHVDAAESLAISRAKSLFGAQYVNVQPHSGSQANMAVYFAMLEVGDSVLGMNLAHGGHLTHGSKVSFSGRIFNFAHYGVDRDSGIIDYDEMGRLVAQHRPKMIVAGASAYPRFIDFEAISKMAASVGALFMVDMAHIAGLVAAGVHPSPIPHADIVTSTTHKTLRGPRGGLILARSEYGDKIDRQIFPGIQGGPLMHIIAAKAVAFKEAFSQNFKSYQAATVNNAKALAARLMKNGLQLVSGGTDNHLMLVDLTHLSLSGKKAEFLLGCAGITVNKNSIPFETRSPFVTSGIRIGSPTVTSRGMGLEEMHIIADLISNILFHPNSDDVLAKAKTSVQDLCRAFPIHNE